MGFEKEGGRVSVDLLEIHSELRRYGRGSARRLKGGLDVELFQGSARCPKRDWDE
jgi:hypothetical protein